MVRFLFIWISLLVCNTSQAQLIFDNNENCKKIYQSISELKLDQAKIAIKNEQVVDPHNAIHILLANYTDFFQLFFNESPSLYQSGLKKRALRLEVLENADKSSPLYKHSLAMVHYQWFYVKIKHKDYISAIQDLREAYQLFLENKKKFPTYKDGDVHVGAIKMAVGSLPKTYKWLVGLLGIKGDLTIGNQLIDGAINNKSSAFYADNLLIYSYAKHYLMHDAKLVWQTLKPYKTQAPNNRLLTFMLANIALNHNKAEEASSIISQNINKTGFSKVPILDYEMGMALLQQLDMDAIKYFKSFLNNYKGSVYVKDAYYKLAMCYWIQGNSALAKSNILLIDKNGSAETDADKTAQAFYEKIKNNQPMPNVELLKARFLNDGGLNLKALDVLKNISKPVTQELEYLYRKGRVFDDMNKKDSAIVYYEKSIQLGYNSTAYFAAKAALQMAYIYEEQKQFAKAKKYYGQILDMPKHESQNSIEQKAKAGLLRVE